MSKRQRHIFPTNEIAHLWAHQTQDHASNPQHNFYFDGPTIYSYRNSFPVATLFKNKKKTIVLLTNDNYSPTTSKHVWAARSAVNHLDMFVVPSRSGSPYHSDNLAYFQREVTKEYEAAKRAKQLAPNHFHAMVNTHDAAKRYAAFFKIKNTVKLPIVGKKLEAFRLECLAREQRAKELEATRADREPQLEAAREKRELARQAKREKENAEKLARIADRIQQWRNGEYVSFPYGVNVPTMLRIKTLTSDGDTSDVVVETSRGARVPIEHAIRGLRLVRAVMARGAEYKRNGHTEHLGPYAVDRIAVNGTLFAGCHVITWDEINRIAPALDNYPNPVTGSL